MTKAYKAEKGVELDSSFAFHCSRCDVCKRFEANKPATVSLLCLEGSVLWKRENVTATPRSAPARGDHYASAAEVKRLMRYKE